MNKLLILFFLAFCPSASHAVDTNKNINFTGNCTGSNFVQSIGVNGAITCAAGGSETNTYTSSTKTFTNTVAVAALVSTGNVIVGVLPTVSTLSATALAFGGGSTVSVISGSLNLGRSGSNNDIFINSLGKVFLGGETGISGTGTPGNLNLVSATNALNAIGFSENTNSGTWYVYPLNNNSTSELHFKRDTNTNSGIFSLSNTKVNVNGPANNSETLNVNGNLYMDQTNTINFQYQNVAGSEAQALSTNLTRIITVGNNLNWSEIDLAPGASSTTYIFTGTQLITPAASTVTIKGNAFGVGGSTFVVTGGLVGILQAAPQYAIDVNGGGRVTGQLIVASSMTVQGGLTGLWSRTMAQIDAITPTAVGAVLFCSNCTTPDVCVSTGTAVSQFRRIGTTAGCGTGN